MEQLAASQLAELRSSAPRPADSGDDRLTALAADAMVAQDPLSAAGCYATAAATPGVSESVQREAALGLVEAGEPLAAVPLLLKALLAATSNSGGSKRRRKLGAAEVAALQRGIARGLTAAALGHAAHGGSIAIGQADGGPDLAEVLTAAQHAEPLSFPYGKWVSAVYTDLLGQPQSSAPVLGTNERNDDFVLTE